MNARTPFYYPTHTPDGKPWLRKGTCMIHFCRLFEKGASVFVQALSTGSDEPTNMLFDISYKSDVDRIIEYLKWLGVEHLDLLVITHPHDDHMGFGGGGTLKIFQNFNVRRVWSTGHPYPLWYDGVNPSPDNADARQVYSEFLDYLFPDGYTVGSAGQVPGISGASIIPYHEPRCVTEPEVHWFGDLKLKVLHPGQTLTTNNLNNDSIVTQITWGNTAFLICGDLEALGGSTILSRVSSGILSASDLKADVMQIGHHANDNSVHLSFLSAVSPKWAVFQNGAVAHYISPMEIDRLDKAGVEPINAFTEADHVIFMSDGYSVKRIQ